MNKISVNIYDKDYTVVGDQAPEKIAEMSAHVDRVMREIGQEAPDLPMSGLAVLSAMNIVDELFKTEERNEELKRLNKQYEADTQHYVQLWEESKKNFSDYKQENQQEMDGLREEVEMLKGKLMQKDREVESVMQNQKNIEAAAMEGSQEVVKQAEQKYNELENNFFDLQMENIQLKSEIEKLRNNMEWKKDEQQGF